MSIQGMYQSGLTKQIMDQRMTQHAAVNQDLADENDALIVRNQAQAARIRQLEALLAQHQTALVEARLENAGLKAQVSVLRPALAKANPNDELFSKTGKAYPNGVQQTKLGAVYEAAFDAEASVLKLPKAGKEYRLVAK